MNEQLEFLFAKDICDSKTRRYTLVASRVEVDDLLILSSQFLGLVKVGNSNGQRELRNLSYKDVMFFTNQGLSHFEIYKEGTSNAEGISFYLGYTQFQSPITRELDRVVWLTE